MNQTNENCPNVTRDEAGLKKLFKQFSFPGGISSHVAPTTPGSILYDKTIRQQKKDGTPFLKVLTNAGIIPGIKVDTGWIYLLLLIAVGTTSHDTERETMNPSIAKQR